MKKILFMMVFVFGMILTSTHYVQACDIGTSHTFTMVFDDCEILVGLCVDCAVTTTPTIIYEYFIYLYQECEILTAEQIKAEILEYITNEYRIQTIFCPTIGLPPPCDPEEDGQRFKIRVPLCWSSDGNGGTFACGTDKYCETEWDVCWTVNGIIYSMVESIEYGEELDCSNDCYYEPTIRCPED